MNTLKRSFICIAVLLLTTVQGAWAQYITEVKVIGHNKENSISELRETYRNQGWTLIDKDLNVNSFRGFFIVLPQ